MLVNKLFLRFVVIFLPISFLFLSSVCAATEGGSEGVVNENERAQVLSTFIGKPQGGALVESFDERREQHKILFYMGVLLLISVLLTAGFGVSMVMLGKEVFVQHMIFAGITVFLSIAHAVVAVVWFFPF
ncbi:MAG TPA: hypothetical protein ENK06_04270 [Gammaproteobacteria bacterium]|nr:hypothetical protein [Gammaproteobacteria bacterium]